MTSLSSSAFLLAVFYIYRLKPELQKINFIDFQLYRLQTRLAILSHHNLISVRNRVRFIGDGGIFADDAVDDSVFGEDGRLLHYQ